MLCDVLLEPRFNIEQEYTLMKKGTAGTGCAIGRPVANEHYMKRLAAVVKSAGTNAEVMPGQCRYRLDFKCAHGAVGTALLR